MSKIQNPLNRFRFDEQKFFDNLKDKIADKPFFEEYKNLKGVSVTLSYVFNVISVIGFVFAAYYVAHLLFGDFYIATIIAVVIGYYFEKLKRMSSEEFWQYFFCRGHFHKGWFILSICLFITSLLGTAYGLKKGTNTLAAPADIVAFNDQSINYEAKIANLQKENTKLSQNKNSAGEIYWPSQKAIQANTKTIADYEKEVQRINKKTEGFNDLLTKDHKQEVEITGWVFVAINVFFEFLFELCIAFIWYYFARSLIEKEGHHPTPPLAQVTQAQYERVLNREKEFMNRIAEMNQIISEHQEWNKVLEQEHAAWNKTKSAEQLAAEQNLRNTILETEQKNKFLAEQLSEQKRRNKKERKKYRELLAEQPKPNHINGSVPSPN